MSIKHTFLFICTFGVIATLPAIASEPDGTLSANGDASNTYTWITDHGFQVEAADNSRQHASAPVRHVSQTWDETLGENVFQFFIHALIDDDRGLADVNDRQRTEIKTSLRSPSFMVAQEGDSVVMRWKFCLPKGMLTTSRFTHIHQLKGIDNKAGTADVGIPLITFTCCSTSSNNQELQVRWQNRNDGDNSTYLVRTNLKPLLGVWLEAEECVRYGAKGSYALTIRRVDTGEIVARVKSRRLDMWRTGSAGLRPKWGIYRYIGENRSMEHELRDEELRFADFSIQPISATSVNNIKAKPISQATYTLQGMKVNKLLSQNVYISNGRKFINNLK